METIDKARQVAGAALVATHPHLRPVQDGDGLVTAAKNLRIELARAFPGVRFSVKTSRFSMGDSIRVRWLDGPTVGQVEPIANRYEGGAYDSERDLYVYHRNAWREVFGWAKYVHVDRQDSPRAVASALRTVAMKWGPLPDTATPENWERGGLGVLYLPRRPDDSLQSLVRRELARRTWHVGRREVQA